MRLSRIAPSDKIITAHSVCFAVSPSQARGRCKGGVPTARRQATEITRLKDAGIRPSEIASRLEGAPLKEASTRLTQSTSQSAGSSCLPEARDLAGHFNADDFRRQRIGGARESQSCYSIEMMMLPWLPGS